MSMKSIESKGISADWERELREAVRGLRYGSVELVVSHPEETSE